MNKTEHGFTPRQIEIMEAATNRIDRFGIQNLTIKNLAGDVGVSEPALYRHFNSKNDILISLLDYFIDDIKIRIKQTVEDNRNSAGEELRALFRSQLKAIKNNPAMVSILFAESIFQFDDDLRKKVSELMTVMHSHVQNNIRAGQLSGAYSTKIQTQTLTTIIMGSLRMAVLKWKLSGHSTELVNEGMNVIEGILTLIENTGEHKI